MRKNLVQTYSIGNVAKMTGATKKQIRNWEAKGYIPEAARVVSGVRAYRRFTLDQVETTSKIKEFLNEGFTLLAAAEKAKTSNLQTRKVSMPGGSD